MVVARPRQHANRQVTQRSPEPGWAAAKRYIENRGRSAKHNEPSEWRVHLASPMRQSERDKVHAAAGEREQRRIERAIGLKKQPSGTGPLNILENVAGRSFRLRPASSSSSWFIEVNDTAAVGQFWTYGIFREGRHRCYVLI
jgi:hypothetical protein